MSDQKNEKIRGRVAQIISSRELAINIGQEHGVQAEMKFAVLAATPLEIRDPDSGEVLDTIEREKVRVEATTVRPKVTVCRTYQTRHVPGGPLYYLARPAYMDPFRPPRTVVETLTADQESYPQPLSEEESYVKIGDPVVQIDD